MKRKITVFKVSSDRFFSCLHPDVCDIVVSMV